MAVLAPVRFGVFELDPRSRELRKHGIRLKLQDQPLKLLEALLEHPGELVTREELQQRLWSGDTFVDFDQSLNRAVNRVREVLGDEADVPRFIETLPRRGYRFIAPVKDGPTPVGTTLPEPAPSASAGGHKESIRPAVLFSGAVVLLAAAAVIAVVSLRETPDQIPVLRFTFGPPDNSSFVRTDGVLGSFAVSPDGKRIVFSARSRSSNQLWIRYLDRLTAQPLAGTENAQFPFWSPDNASIAFIAGSKMKTMDLASGRINTLADVPGIRGGTWNRAGVILFFTNPGEPLRRVPATGGVVMALSDLDTAKAGADHLWPSFLPDGRHFLFSTLEAPSGSHWTIRAGALDSRDTRVIRQADSNAVFAGGYLLFQWESVLMAQPFDAKRLMTTGPSVPIAEGLGSLVGGKGSFAVSGSGMLAYARRQEARLIWLDRTGNEVAAVGEPCSLGRIHLSPDGNRASVAVTTGSSTNIWIYEVHSGIRTRLTFEPSTDMIGVWSPDGRAIVFDSSRNGRHDLYRKSTDGGSQEELLYADNFEKGPSSWSPDGRFLLYNSLSPTSGWGIWVLPLKLDQPPKPYPFLETAFNEQQGQFSPDGRWVLYTSNESGQNEIYAARFPGAGEKRRISLAGGSQPRWRGNGKELFYVAPDGTLIAVEVTGTLQIGSTRPLFVLPLGAAQGFSYAVAADGRRFLAKAPARGSSLAGHDALTVAQNWMQGLEK